MYGTKVPAPQPPDQSMPTLVAYNPKVKLVDIRRDPVAFPRISATPREEAIKKMVPLVYAAFLYRGQETTAEKVKFIATALVDEIMADPHFGLQTLSWMEIGMVIRKAVLGGSKELFGVSVASLYSALIDYAKTDGHEASRMASNTPRPPMPQPQPEEIEYTPF